MLLYGSGLHLSTMKPHRAPRNSLQNMAPEILLEISSFLDPKDTLARLRLVTEL
jgi:hypothetical protein